MDEHDKRAREVAEAVLGPLNADGAYIAFVAARIGALFRGLTAAAVAAERERLAQHLRARADEEEKESARWRTYAAEHGVVKRERAKYAATLLRAEADALEGT